MISCYLTISLRRLILLFPQMLHFGLCLPFVDSEQWFIRIETILCTPAIFQSHLTSIHAFLWNQQRTILWYQFGLASWKSRLGIHWLRYLFCVFVSDAFMRTDPLLSKWIALMQPYNFDRHRMYLCNVMVHNAYCYLMGTSQTANFIEHFLSHFNLKTVALDKNCPRNSNSLNSIY